MKYGIVPDNVVALLPADSVPEPAGFLTLDIDGYDNFVLEKIRHRYRSRLICVEVNEKIPPPIKFSVRGDPGWPWADDHRHGASVSKMHELSVAHQYALTELHYRRAFRVPEERAHGASRRAEAGRSPATDVLHILHNMEPIERIAQGHVPLAFIIRAGYSPGQTTFVTPPDFKQQVGYVVYPAGGEIVRHTHLPLERHLVGTSEVLVLQSGRCLIDIYGSDRELVATRELQKGDVMLMVGGGHGFRMLEDTVFLEIKQGPYTGLEEKERF